MKVSLRELMEQSGVKFGTSGARGMADAMTDRVCHTYTTGFLQFLQDVGELKSKDTRVAVAGDYRPSTERIAGAVCRAIADLGYEPEWCGHIPSPAVAMHGLHHRIPSIMVTGSHIPDDRNGIKFNKCSGELLKTDEPGMTSQIVDIDDAAFDSSGVFIERVRLEPPYGAALADYISRYLELLDPDSLSGMRVGVYQHSAVGRDVMVEILSHLGARVTKLGRSDAFIPVDTEAIRPEDVRLAREWVAEHAFDAIVSADGDSDRPLIADEQGEWLRGDVAGILCAKFLGADCVCTPVSCNTAVEKCRQFQKVVRTRIGSPYVIAAMMEAEKAGSRRVVGYEANGGFLLQTDVDVSGRVLRALPTRDAMIVILSILCLSRQRQQPVSRLTGYLPARFTASGLLKQFPTEKSQAILKRFSSGDEAKDLAELAAVFSAFGKPGGVDRTDGVRVTFDSGEIVHLRPSGNAPEFRCYTESDTAKRAGEMAEQGLAILRGL